MKKKTIKRLAVTGLIAVVAAFGLTGCGKSKAADDKELKEFRVGVGGSDDSFTAYLGNVAYEKGYLEEELNKVGYTIKFETFGGGGPEINEAIASGNLDGAIYGDFPAFTSKSNGIDTTVIAAVNSRQQYAIISSNPDIKEAKDLEGKKVIVAQGTVSQFFWEHYAEARGIDTSKVDIINATSDAQSLLVTGDADAYVMVPSALYYMESLGLGTVIDTGADIPDGSTTYLFVATNSILDKSPEVAVAVNKALIRANESITDDIQVLYDSTASETITADYTKRDYEFDDVLNALSPEITDTELAHFDELNDWLLGHEIITEKVDVASFVNTTYYDEAKKELNNN